MTQYITKPAEQFGGLRQLDCYSDDLAHSRRRLPVLVDLRHVTFVRPVAVVATVLFIQEMFARNRKVSIAFPTRRGTLNYLLQTGLRPALDTLGVWNWPETFPETPTPGVRPMIPITRFSTSSEVEALSEQISSVFDSTAELPSNLRSPCHQVFSEIADNVLNHSESFGYVLVQRFEYTEGPVIDLTIGDGGIGIRNSLWKNSALRPRFHNDRQALELAMEDGVTAVADMYRGFGLGYVKGELSARGRWLVIRSGTATVDWREGAQIASHDAGASVGTLVHAVIPC